MRLNVFVRFKGEKEFCQWPVLQDRRNKRGYSIGSLLDPYPTEYTKRTVGSAVAFALSRLNVEQVEVKQAPDYDQQSRDNDAAGQASSPGYAEASGVYN